VTLVNSEEPTVRWLVTSLPKPSRAEL